MLPIFYVEAPIQHPSEKEILQHQKRDLLTRWPPGTPAQPQAKTNPQSTNPRVPGHLIGFMCKAEGQEAPPGGETGTVSQHKNSLTTVPEPTTGLSRSQEPEGDFEYLRRGFTATNI